MPLRGWGGEKISKKVDCLRNGEQYRDLGVLVPVPNSNDNTVTPLLLLLRKYLSPVLKFRSNKEGRKEGRK